MWMGDSMFGVIQRVSPNESSSLVQQFGYAIGDSTGSRSSGSANYTGKALAAYYYDNRSASSYTAKDLEIGDFNLEYNFYSKMVTIEILF